jgi:hypothetical protein
MANAHLYANSAALVLLSARGPASDRVDVCGASATPPAAPLATPHADTLRGAELVDPFRWLEDRTDVRVRE